MNKSKKFKLKFSRKALSYPYMLFLLIFVVAPLVLILINAFLANGKLTFDNFVDFFTKSDGLMTMAHSLTIGLTTVVLCLLIGYPTAYFLAKYHAGNKVLVLMFILPMWINFLIRTLATKAIFVALNIELGLGTVIFGMVYNFLPFMILPLHTSLVSIDKSLVEASQDLGADGLTVFLKTTLPLSLSGIISGITMVFIPAISTFAISQLLSVNNVYLLGDTINAQFAAHNFGVGSVMSLVMLLFVVISTIFVNMFNKNDGTGVNVL